MQSYIENYNRYWEFFQNSVITSSQNSHLQSLPTNTTSNQTNFIGTLTNSSSIRNSYLNPSTRNDCEDQIKSAFKPVKPRILFDPIPAMLPMVRNNNFDLSIHTSSVDSNTTFKTLPGSIYASFNESYNHTSESTTFENVKKDLTSSTTVNCWSTLLPILPEKKTHNALPTRHKGTRIQYRQKFKAFYHQITQFEDNSVPIIDLTSEQEQSDKYEETVQSSKATNTYQMNKTPPIDVNQNGKLIIQNTMMPPKKQIRLTAKHNQWHKQIRTYNGFRLFARRNQSYAKKHTNESENDSIVNSVLVKWWNTASAHEKEHYAQVAEVIIENQLRSTYTVTRDDKKIQNDFAVSEQTNTIQNQDCAKPTNELPIDIVNNKIIDAKVDLSDSGTKSSNGK